MTLDRASRKGGAFSVNDYGYGVIDILTLELHISYTSFSINQEYIDGTPTSTSASCWNTTPKLEINAFGWGKPSLDITD